MTGSWKTEENQNQVSRPFPPALGNRCAISTFSPAPAEVVSRPKRPTKTKERSSRFALA